MPRRRAASYIGAAFQEERLKRPERRGGGLPFNRRTPAVGSGAPLCPPPRGGSPTTDHREVTERGGAGGGSGPRLYMASMQSASTERASR